MHDRRAPGRAGSTALFAVRVTDHRPMTLARASFRNIQVETGEHVATVTIARPEKRNALDRHTLEELRQVFDTLSHSTDIGAVIVTGDGERVFAAGADLTEMRD